MQINGRLFYTVTSDTCIHTFMPHGSVCQTQSHLRKSEISYAFIYVYSTVRARLDIISYSIKIIQYAVNAINLCFMSKSTSHGNLQCIRWRNMHMQATKVVLLQCVVCESLQYTKIFT